MDSVETDSPGCHGDDVLLSETVKLDETPTLKEVCQKDINSENSDLVTEKDIITKKDIIIEKDKIVPLTTNISVGKFSSPNNIIVGTIYKTVSVKNLDVPHQKLLLAPYKSKDGSVTRLILPRPPATAPVSTSTVSTISSTTPTIAPALSVVLPPSSCKQLGKSYVVSPAVTSSSKTKPSTISILSRNAVVIDPQTSRPVQSKLLPPNIIRQKNIDPKIITNSVIKPFNILQAKKLLANSSSGSINVVNSKQTFTQAKSDVKFNTMMKPESRITITTKEDESNNDSDQIKQTTETNLEEKMEVESEEPAKENEDNINDKENEDKESNDDSKENDKETVTDPVEKSPIEKPPIEKSPVEKSPVEIPVEKTPIVKTPPMSKAPVERVRKRKSHVLTKGPTPVRVFTNRQENVKLLPGAEELDPFKTIEWEENGLGSLPGCEFKMTVNEFGMLEIHDDSTLDGNDKTNGNESQGPLKKRDPDEIYCCVACSCYGLLTEFYNENYCSTACRDNLIAQQQAICNKPEPEEPPKEKPKEKPKEDASPPPPKPVPNEPENYMDDVIELDEDDSNSEPVYNNKSLLKKHVKNDQKIKIKSPFKIKNKIEYPIPQTNKLELKTINNKKTSNYKTSKKPRFSVAQDLDPGECVEVKLDTRFSNGEPNQFPWGHYLSSTNSKPTWIRLFCNPFPASVNRFSANTYLEAIDPEHQSYFCVVRVASIKGYRLKLHFDGYPSMYDFWVNADSPNIYPCGFCKQHGIQLHPPLGLPKASFEWKAFHTLKNTRRAPNACFPSLKLNNMTQNLFRVGMKLEAVDKKNTFLVCVASVAGLIEERILVHFDSWGEVYDYWVNISSPYIHPVGWCKENNHELTPPNGYKAATFSWDTYLKKTGSTAAPVKAFCLRPPLEFKKGTKLEAVDKRSPHLLRVATIKEVLPYQIKIQFDGFPEHFGYWVDDDCPDIHPIGWGNKTGHPVEAPPCAAKVLNSSCPTPGCVGDGHYKSPRLTHSIVDDCPYSYDHLDADHYLWDRLNYSRKSYKRYGDDVIDLSDDEDSEKESASKRWSFLNVRSENCKNNTRIPDKNQDGEKPFIQVRKSKSFDQYVPEPNVNLDTNSRDETLKGTSEESNDKNSLSGEEMEMEGFDEMQTFDTREPFCLKWTVEEVCDYIKTITSSFDKFKDQEIHGDSLLMLSLQDLKDCLGLTEEEACSVYEKIKTLRHNISPNEIAFQP